ncbi:MAG: hypothetical protein AB4426_12575 [Xenococcaceae cyanobacterium]
MTTTETELKELKELINSRFDELKNEITDLKIGQAKIEASLETLTPLIQKIPDLAEKVGEVKNWRQIALVLIGGVIGGLVTWLFKR